MWNKVTFESTSIQDGRTLKTTCVLNISEFQRLLHFVKSLNDLPKFLDLFVDRMETLEVVKMFPRLANLTCEKHPRVGIVNDGQEMFCPICKYEKTRKVN